jgi:hypothetical protein
MWARNIDDFNRGEVSFISYSNAQYPLVKDLEKFGGFHIIRDPRDILVSSYFSSLYSHATANWPELESHRAQLTATSKEEGLLLEMDFISDVFQALGSWNYDDPRILEVKMEDLMQNNYTEFLKIAVHMGLVDESDESTSSIVVQTRNQLGLLRNRLAAKTFALSWLASYPEKLPVLNFLGIVHRNRFAAMAAGRVPGKEDSSSHYRKGVSGDWHNHFTRTVEEKFKSRWGELFIKLGYEENLQ